MKITLDLEFGVGDRVTIDGGDVRGVVTGIWLNYAGLPNKPTQLYARYEVCWFASGGMQREYLDEWRLTKE